MIGEVGCIHADAIARKTLLDSRVEASRMLWFQIRVPVEARCRAVRLKEGRFLDAQPGAAVQPCGARIAAVLPREPGDRRARRRIESETAVVLKPDTADRRDGSIRHLV